MLAKKILSAGGRVTLAAAPEGRDGQVLAELAAEAPAGVLHVARDEGRMAALAEVAGFFRPEVEVVRLPAWDCLPYDRVSPHPTVEARRMDAFCRLAATPSRGRLILTTVNAALQRTPARERVAGATFRARPGERMDLAALHDFLARNGFNRAGTVMEAGEFAQRGGILDIFPPGAAAPLRLDLFGDVLESLRAFDPLTQRTTGPAAGLDLVPMSEIALTPESIERFRTGYRALFGAVTDDDPLYASVSEGRKHIGMEHWLPLFHERLETAFDYAPEALVTHDHLVEEAVAARLAQIEDHHQARQTIQGGALAQPYKPLPPDRLYLTADEWAGLHGRRAVADFTPFQAPAGARTIDAGGRPARDFAPERAQAEVNVFDALRGHVEAERKAGRRVLVAAFSRGSADRLGLVLRDHGLAELRPAESWAEAQALPTGCAGLVVLPIEHGFVADALSVIGEQDILGDRLVRPGRRSRRAESYITEATELSPGDLVVHVEHGIGRYEGLKTLEVSGAPHDCIHLTYEGGDKLYVPVENIEMLSRYGSGEAGAPLDKLGGVGWQARKAKLKKRIRDMADELIRIAAARQLKRAPAVTAPEGLYDEFAARFPYEETDDQRRAIDDVFADLAAGRPMDRLICGDVGFGKTEVALRSAFAAVMQGGQVAVIAPTTLLSRQHHRTFRERFAGLPVRIGQLSRLVPAKEAAATREGLASGEVDIVIGTHALLGKQVRFKNLLLMVIDEEQHFGVKHKERLKQLRADVHVLTLTATPIPRTMQLALSGVKELSVIATPPVDRLAVRTFVLPFDGVTVREALLRERYRGGQSFYVCPRIEDLPDAAEFLRLHVPEVKFITAHGRLPAAELEQVMTAFYDGGFDVLVSTTIVESGLDIPTANTLIVHRADMFGLAQLYQLRGRIGRSKQRAYAYFTLPPRRQITPVAERRLQVLQSLDSLGAGFALASHDLDIRGAGNLLGEEQSGHIREVGLELYQQMLEEAVAAAKAGGEAEGDGDWSPQIGVGAAVLIPEGYVADLGVRLGLYRRLAGLAEQREIDEVAAELVDRFGPLPDEVEHLLKVVRIKQLCRQANVEKVDAGPRGATLAFRGNRFADPAGLVALIAEGRGAARLRPDHRLVYMRAWDEPADRLKGVAELMERLARLAAAPAYSAA